MNNRKNFCAAPWAGLSLDPDGSAKICCISQNRDTIDNISDIITNKKFIEIRNAVIKDEQHLNCQGCWEQEKNSSKWISRRSIYQYADFYNDLSDPNTFQLEHLDVRWSNTCNLNCVYCGPTFSSKWSKLLNYKQSYRIFPVFTSDNLANIRTLQLAGGEPLLIKENYDLLKQIPVDANIEITTNLTNIQNNKIYEILKTFKNVKFVISFESTHNKFEYIRNGANWNQFINNLKIVTTDFKNVDVNMVYFSLSSISISDAIDIALQFVPDNNIFIVSQNGGHGFDMLSQKALAYTKEKNIAYAELLSDTLKNRLLSQVLAGSTSRTKTMLPDYDKFDKLVNQNHRLIFKELYD
jgi:hypothetical protein